MIFQHTWQQVLTGEKTQTRRLVKPVHCAWSNEFDIEGQPIDITDVRIVYEESYATREVWRVGKTYAVQPGRGKKAVGRIRITAIRREALQDVSCDDALQEGAYPYGRGIWSTAVEEFAELWDSIHDKPGTTWNDNPAVWVLTFELALEN